MYNQQARREEQVTAAGERMLAAATERVLVEVGEKKSFDTGTLVSSTGSFRSIPFLMAGA